MRLKKRFTALFAALMLFCVMSAIVHAGDLPDISKEGLISVTMRCQGSPVSGGTLTLYRAGALAENGGDYSFVLDGDFADSGAELTNISSPELAKYLARYAGKQHLAGVTSSIGSDGKVSFGGLEPGLFLLVQTKAASGYKKVTPFLVTVPMQEDGSYSYSVDASPKVELEKESDSEPEEPAVPETPAKPSGPKLPQTGQLNWPIPVLVIAGLALLAVGWVLCYGKKDDHEA